LKLKVIKEMARTRARPPYKAGSSSTVRLLLYVSVLRTL
jgi:hypothetical protein